MKGLANVRGRLFDYCASVPSEPTAGKQKAPQKHTVCVSHTRLRKQTQHQGTTVTTRTDRRNPCSVADNRFCTVRKRGSGSRWKPWPLIRAPKSHPAAKHSPIAHALYKTEHKRELSRGLPPLKLFETPAEGSHIQLASPNPWSRLHPFASWGPAGGRLVGWVVAASGGFLPSAPGFLPSWAIHPLTEQACTVLYCTIVKVLPIRSRECTSATRW